MISFTRISETSSSLVAVSCYGTSCSSSSISVVVASGVGFSGSDRQFEVLLLRIPLFGMCSLVTVFSLAL